MRIALLAERYAPDLGGADRQVADWATWLAGRGHAVHLFVFDVLDEPPPEFAIRRIDASGTLRARAERIEAAARAAGVDLLQDLGAGLGGDLFQPLRRGGSSALAAERLRRCKLAVAGSARGAEALGRIGRAGKVRIVPPGVDSTSVRPPAPGDRAADRARSGWSDGSMVILATVPEAGVRRIAVALLAVWHARRRRADARLALLDAGEGSAFRRALLDGLRRIGALSLVARRDFGARRAADVFLQLCRGEAGHDCLEAMASGLPVIVARSDEAAALIVDGVQGLMIDDAASARDIAWQIRYLSEAGLRGAMGAQARVLATHLDRASSFIELEALCRELAPTRAVAAG